METESVKLAFFSPTGTTRAVVRAVASGIGLDRTEWIDVTSPEARRRPLTTSEKELLVVAVPVYMGRVPELLQEWLHSIRARSTPTVCVVVYGNRAYEDALLELTDAVRERGCVPIAGAAYIGEHSFSSPELPTAQGRPDGDDLDHAEAFGRKIREKLRSVSALEDISDLTVPGNRPYGGRTKLWDVDFIAVDGSCTNCGLCAEICPVGAIDARDGVIDQEKCITCCACIKNCPEGARSMKPGPVMDAANRLHSNFGEPKAPECFL